MNNYWLKSALAFVIALAVSFYAYQYLARSTTDSPEVIAPPAVTTPITISGIYTCLPKNAPEGEPVTLECALGLKTDSGYYALDTSVVESDNYPALTGNESITVEGSLVPVEMISSDRFATYDVIGVIAVDKLTIDK